MLHFGRHNDVISTMEHAIGSVTKDNGFQCRPTDDKAKIESLHFYELAVKGHVQLDIFKWP